MKAVTFSILLFAAVAFADDFRTIDGCLGPPVGTFAYEACFVDATSWDQSITGTAEG